MTSSYTIERAFGSDRRTPRTLSVHRARASSSKHAVTIGTSIPLAHNDFRNLRSLLSSASTLLLPLLLLLLVLVTCTPPPPPVLLLLLD